MPKKTIRGFIHDLPDMHFTSNGKAVTTLYLFQFLYADKSDNDKPLQVTAWEELAEACAYKLKPTDELYLSGHFRTNTWAGEDKQVHSQQEFTAQKIWLITGSGADEEFIDIMQLAPEENNNAEAQSSEQKE